MKLNIVKSHTRNEMGVAAANAAYTIIMDLLSHKDEINVCFAAAPSQNEFLANLIAHTDIPFNRINAFHMDEYIGLPADAPQGFFNFLQERLFSKVNFKSTHPVTDVDTYEKLLLKNPLDLVCMGIGENGHIAFNDPPVADFNDPHLVKIVQLDNICRTQQVNDGCFSELSYVPTHAITLTIPALINCNNIICTVPAITKAQAVYNTLNAKISTNCPSTILREHKNATLFIDSDSSSLL